MRICYIVEFKIPDAHGGSTHTCEIAKNLSLLGNDVYVISSSLEQEDLKMKGFFVFGIKKRKIPSLLPLKALRPLLLLIKILKVIKMYDIDVLYVRGSELDAAGTLAGLLTGRPVVLEVHHPTYTHFSAKYVNKIIAVGINRRILKNIRCDVIEVSNAVDHEVFNPAINGLVIRSKYGITSDDIVVLYSGGFYPWHGLEELIEAAKMLTSKRGLKVKFLMVGEGPLYRKIKKLVENYGLQELFIFAGKVPYEVMPHLIASADIAVAPFNPAKDPLTRKYGFFYSPLKLFEYMACEKPVISTSVGNICKIIEHGKTGLLVPPANPEALADAIELLIKDRELASKLGMRARQEVIEKYSWKGVANKIFTEMLKLKVKRKSLGKAFLLILFWYMGFLKDGVLNILRSKTTFRG
jgi:glycosyltransferase involved in cell wall biosynthesis